MLEQSWRLPVFTDLLWMAFIGLQTEIIESPWSKEPFVGLWPTGCISFDRQRSIDRGKAIAQ
jgi:hypothetical protein